MYKTNLLPILNNVKWQNQARRVQNLCSFWGIAKDDSVSSDDIHSGIYCVPSWKQGELLPLHWQSARQTRTWRSKRWLDQPLDFAAEFFNGNVYFKIWKVILMLSTKILLHSNCGKIIHKVWFIIHYKAMVLFINQEMIQNFWPFYGCLPFDCSFGNFLLPMTLYYFLFWFYQLKI